jgi:hypothetical protein
MFDAPVDAWYIWLGLGTVSVAVAGVAVGLPSAAAPDAAGVAERIDTVAASPYEAADTIRLDATELRLGSTRVSLRGDGGTSHATLAYGPVVPVGDGPLDRVLRGTSPSAVFDSRVEFERAVSRARAADHAWRPAPARLHVRRVSWGDVDATLVG